MAEHDLRITAHLDVSQLNQELDRLNQQRGGDGTNDTTGNGISLGMRLRQLQLSLDNLNKTLQTMVRSSHGEGTQGSGGGNDDLGNELAPFMKGANRGLIPHLAQRTALSRMMIANANRAGYDGAGAWYRGGAYRNAVMYLPENQQLAAQYIESRLKDRQSKEEYEIDKRLDNARRWRMGIAVGGHFAGMLGHSLQEAGYQRAGGAFNILSGTMGGAASGAMMGGGPWGLAIGALVGGAASAASEIKKMRDASEQAALALERLRTQAETQLFKYGQSRDIDWATKRGEDNWMSMDELRKTQLFAQGRVDFFKRQLEGEDGKGGMYAELRRLEEDIENGNVGAETGRTQKRVLELLPQIQQMENLMEQWGGVVGDFQKRMDLIDPYSNENHEKFVEEMNRQAEMERENEEKRKQLLMEREQILLGIEQEYAQQGVDILSGMGKSGKYMSQAEAASTSQERYAPITKKLDTMQKSLDHLSQIDAKLRNLNLGLT